MLQPSSLTQVWTLGQSLSGCSCPHCSLSLCAWMSVMRFVVCPLLSCLCLCLDAWPDCEALRSRKVLVAQLCLTLYDPNDCSSPGSSVHGILQARRVEAGTVSWFIFISVFLHWASLRASGTLSAWWWMKEWRHEWMSESEARATEWCPSTHFIGLVPMAFFLFPFIRWLDFFLLSPLWTSEKGR